MVDNTQNYALPYPAASDTVRPATRDIVNLATTVDAVLPQVQAAAVEEALSDPSLEVARGLDYGDSPAAFRLLSPDSKALDVVMGDADLGAGIRAALREKHGYPERVDPSRSESAQALITLTDAARKTLDVLMADGSLSAAVRRAMEAYGYPRYKDGQALLSITGAGDRVLDVIMPDGSLGPGIKVPASAVGGAQSTQVVHPSQDIYQTGTSLTRLGGVNGSYKYCYGYAAAREIGRTDFNMGWTGRDSKKIAGKNGALPWLVTTAATIPADTDTTVNLSLSWEIEDTIQPMNWIVAGVPGTLLRGDYAAGLASTVGIFRRKSAGDPVPVRVGEQAAFEGYAPLAQNRTIVLECSRNNDPGEDPAVVVAHQKAIIRKLTSGVTCPRYLIMSEPIAANSRDGGIQTGEAATVPTRLARRAAIKAAFPEAYVPAFEWLLSAECEAWLLSQKSSPASWLGQEEKDDLAAWAGFTEQDRADIAAGITPTSLRMDWLHPNRLGNLALGHRLVMAMRERNWVL